MKLIGKIVAIVCGVVALLVIVLQIVLNMPFVSSIVDKYAGEFINGKVEYSRLDFSLIRNFPKLRVTVDSLSLTYPHSRYPESDSGINFLDAAGRGEDADTLLSLDRLTVAVNPLRLLSGTVRISNCGFEGFSLYAHRYDSLANWQVFRTSEKPDGDSSAVSIPAVSVGRFIIRNPRMVYTDSKDTVYLDAGFDAFRLSGSFRMDADDGSIRFRNIMLALDSLKAKGYLPADTLSVDVDHLLVDNPMRQMLNIDLLARADACTGCFGRFNVPVSLASSLEFGQSREVSDIDVHSLHAELAHIPLDARGHFRKFADSADVRLHGDIRGCNLGKILEEYGKAVTPLASDISTNAEFNLSLDADGTLSQKKIPALDVSLELPRCEVFLKPMDMAAVVALDVKGTSSPEKIVDADISRLLVESSGINLEMRGGAKGLFGRNARYKASADGLAVLDSLRRFLSDDMELGGKVSLKFDADISQEELESYRFKTAEVSGRIDGDVLKLIMSKDTIDALIGQPRISLCSNPDGLDLTADFDSLYFDKGDSLRARVRDMRNRFRIYKVEERGVMVPRVSLMTDDRFAFVKAGDNRIGLMGTKAEAALQKRVYRKLPIDSLKQRGRFMTAGRSRRHQTDDFSVLDPDFSLDSSIMRYLRQWKPSGELSVKGGFVSTPAFPLRTRFSSLLFGFNDNEVYLDSIYVKTGTSDISAKGHLSNVRHAVMNHGILKANLDVRAGYLNVNEILVAVEDGLQPVEESDTMSETEGTYVVDSIPDAVVDLTKLPVLVVPGNIDATVRASADHVEFLGIIANPVAATIRVKDRTLQVGETSAATNMGDISVDAFFATRSLADLSMGADLRIRNASAEEIISMLPSVDSILPALKSFEGKFDLDLSATTKLDTDMNVNFPSMDGILRIRGRDLLVKDAGGLRKVTKLLLFKNKDIGAVNDLSVDAIVHDNRLEVFPFELSVDRYKLALRGMQGFDKSMNYHVSVLRSPFLIPFGVNIYGYTDNWRFLLGPAKYREGRVPAFSQQLDTMQVNILQSIKDVYKRGVDDARLELAKSRLLMNSSDRNLNVTASETEQRQLDSLNFHLAEAMADAELDSEVEEALQSSKLDMSQLMSDYEKTTADEFIDRRIKALKKKK